MHNYIKISRPEKYKNNIIITWTLASVCNYKCSYCIDNLNNGKFKFPKTYKYMIDFLKQIQDKNPNKKIQLSILGGEPTLWNLLPNFIKECNDLNINIHIDTNGSQNLEWWNSNVEYLSSVCMSFHPEFSNKNHTYNVINNITKLNIKDNITLLLLMLPEYFEYNYSFGTQLINDMDNLSVIFKPVRKNLASDEFFPYTELQKSFMSNYLHSKNMKNIEPWNSKELIIDDTTKISRNIILLNNQNNWNSWYCNAGIESFHIYMNGDIFRCANQVGGIIGNINNQINIIKNPIICNKNACCCAQDISNTKWRKI